jgi:Rps23 Pro-64 3,4-dihydroxylase Tpa1-like proline 4-hydroxylase
MKIYKKTKNLVLIKNVFPTHVCAKLYNLIKKEKKWKFMNQIRPNHYRHVFKSASKIMPNKNEVYQAKFYKSLNLVDNVFIKRSLEKYLPPILKKLNIKYRNINFRCHKFKKNNLMRSHFDHYAGTHSININLNKEWKADWGGLLCVLNGENFENIETLVPEWNALNIIYSKKNKKTSPHFVTSVQKFAKEPRYSITVFLN